MQIRVRQINPRLILSSQYQKQKQTSNSKDNSKSTSVAKSRKPQEQIRRSQESRQSQKSHLSTKALSARKPATHFWTRRMTMTNILSRQSPARSQRSPLTKTLSLMPWNIWYHAGEFSQTMQRNWHRWREVRVVRNRLLCSKKSATY